VNDCYNFAYQNTTQAKTTLHALHKANKLAIVSNFYGNLDHVVDDFGLSNYFETIVDSGNVGVAKPNKEIFMLAIKRLNLSPECCTVVGDSYHKDIMPAKAIGCRTIWLKQKGWADESTSDDADMIISSLTELEIS
jgi:putative hydrolase of the HAD superfamily